MTAPRREWITTFSDEAVLSDLRKAAIDSMREIDDCPPEICPHAENRLTPIEFFNWVEATIHRAAREPVRLDHRETRRAGQVRRRTLEIVAAG